MSRLSPFFSLLVVLLLSPASWGQLLSRLAEGKESSVPGTIVFGKTPAHSAHLTLHLRAKYHPTSLVIRQNPNGSLQFSTLYKNTTMVLPVTFDKDFEGINHAGALKKGFVVQAAEYDITGDKEPEIVIAVGDRLVNLDVQIFQYRAPKEAKGVGIWKRIGSFSGQSNAMLEKDSIILPYGSQGLFEQHQWSAGKFVQVN